MSRPEGPGGRGPDVRARPDGPWVVAPGVVVRHDERVVDPDARRGDVALCRCARTSTLPTCDRSHRTLGDLAEQGWPCTPVDAHVRALGTTCAPGEVWAVHGGVVVGAGLVVGMVGGATVRLDVPALACRCGRHVDAIDGLPGTADVTTRPA